MLLCNRQLVVITHELIYGVRAAHRSGKIAVKEDYCTETLKGHCVLWKTEICYLIRMT